MTRMITSVLVLGAACLFAGCQSTQDSDMDTSVSAGMLNDTCPVAGAPVNPDADSVAWNGGTVGFCCNGCASKWDAMSETDRAARMANLSE